MLCSAVRSSHGDRLRNSAHLRSRPPSTMNRVFACISDGRHVAMWQTRQNRCSIRRVAGPQPFGALRGGCVRVWQRCAPAWATQQWLVRRCDMRYRFVETCCKHVRFMNSTACSILFYAAELICRVDQPLSDGSGHVFGAQRQEHLLGCRWSPVLRACFCAHRYVGPL